MNLKTFALLFLSIIFSAGGVHAKTRQQVVADAVAHETITAWTASTNTYVFDAGMIFQAQYSTGVVYNSKNWPYVYGGREDAAVTSQRINGGACPGGLAVPGSPNTKAVYDWWMVDQNNPGEMGSGLES